MRRVCVTCLHSSLSWDEEPCDSCCVAHSGWEAAMWQVAEFYSNGRAAYQVYRLKEADEPDTEANRERIGTFDMRERAEEFAEALNGREYERME